MFVKTNRLSPLFILIQLAFGGQSAWAQTNSLTVSPKLEDKLSVEAIKSSAIYVSGDKVAGSTEDKVIVEGAAEFRKPGTVLKADKVEYEQNKDEVFASGNVRLNRLGNTFEGPEAKFQLETFKGYFLKPQYQFLANGGNGQADKIDFLGDKKTTISNASYTTCTRVPGSKWLPDWVLEASRIDTDSEENVGEAYGAVVKLKEVPIFALPYMSFPLNSDRKTGFLPPSIASDNVSGLEISTPYYVNLAPNYDLTFNPTLSSKRGVNLGTEFRYLNPTLSGTMNVDVMPSDKLRNNDRRWGISADHQQYIAAGSTVGGLLLNLEVNRVSDNNYWRDFPRATGALTQRILPTNASLGWRQGAWSSGLKFSKWQTLQDTGAVIRPPYDQLPHAYLKYDGLNLNGGFNLNVNTEVTYFKSDPAFTTQANGIRAFNQIEISRPFKSPAYFITPKVKFHNAAYQFDSPLRNGDTSASLSVPTFSLDSGLVFDRSVRLWGRDLTQTLEPRGFYVYTPYREQSLLPNYDSAARDFNFAALFTENPYSGNSRIPDTNVFTYGLSSKFLDANSGAELVRLGMAQRLRFEDQRVILPGNRIQTERLSDLLFGATVNWDPHWSVETTQQVSPSESRLNRGVLGVRYAPKDFHVVSAAYRYQRGVSEQAELSWQWPMAELFGASKDAADGAVSNGRWFTLGRLNYSLTENKMVDSVLGFEYEAGCWVARTVVENVSSSSATSNRRILFQLELVGFGSVGPGALKTLRSNIPRYQYLREQVDTPNRFSNFE